MAIPGVDKLRAAEVLDVAGGPPRQAVGRYTVKCRIEVTRSPLVAGSARHV
jgi:hypothetical protein